MVGGLLGVGGPEEPADAQGQHLGLRHDVGAVPERVVGDPASP
jgi:hypothetical protein